MPEPMTRDALLSQLSQERARLEALLPRFSDEAWRAGGRNDGWSPHDIIGHLADANYGMALLVLGEITPSLPIDETTGWMDVNELNEQRRAKNAALPREKLASRLSSAFTHVQRAIEATEDMNAEGPYGPRHTKGFWLNRMVQHTRQHREELEQILASGQ